MPTDDVGLAALKRQAEAASELATKRLHAALLTSDRVEARAVGHLLAINDVASSRSPSDQEDRCGGEDASCIDMAKARSREVYEEASRLPRDALVQMALDTHNAFIYGLAVEACGTALDGRSHHDGRCQFVTLEEWSRLDADNMVPWLARASVAAGRGDQAETDEALHRASLTSTYSVPASAMAGIADAEMASGYEPFARLSVQTELFGTAMASPLISVGPYSRYCSTEAVREANRYQVCNRLTEAMLAHGTNMLVQRVALAVAEKRLDWSAAKTVPMRVEADVLMGRNMRVQSEEGRYDCANMSGLTAQLARRSRLGELAAMRLEMAESGESQVQALKANREWLDNQRRRAAAEEAAASAASTPYSSTPPPAR